MSEYTNMLTTDSHNALQPAATKARQSSFKGRGKRGFTMMELLTVIAILAIMAAVAFVFIGSIQKNYQQEELDGTAKEIFIAAQNHLSTAESQGLLDRKTPGEQDEGDIYYYVVGSKAEDGYTKLGETSNSVLSVMLPFGSIDETVRTHDTYVIKYNRETAKVLGVFYAHSSSSSLFAASTENYSFVNADYGPLFDSYADDKQKRKEGYTTGGQTAMVGYYGGTDTAALKGEKLQKPSLKVQNAERLTAIVTNPNANIDSGKTAEEEKVKPMLKLIVSGETSKAQKEILLVKEGSLQTSLSYVEYDSENAKFYVYFDDITDAAHTGHFAEIFGADFLPGENIRVQAVAYSATKLTNVAESAKVKRNSLFASITDGSTPTAKISNIRHLENLSKSISGYNPADSRWAGKAPTHAEQTVDLSWTDFRLAVVKPAAEDDSVLLGQQDAGTRQAIEANAAEEVHALTLTGSSEEVPEGSFMPVSPSFALTYDGKSHRISNVIVNKDSGNVGVFGELSGGSISNVQVVNAAITTGSGNAGALLGAGTNNTTVSGCIAFNEITGGNDSAYQITGTSNAGGLVGSMNGGGITLSAAATYVHSSDNAGGLLGSAMGSVSVTNSYAGGHTADAQYRDADDGAAGRINVVGGTSAGGLIGSTAQSTGLSVAGCYSTASVYAPDSGGLIGIRNGGSISNSYAANRVLGPAGTNNHRGAFIGWNQYDITTGLTNNRFVLYMSDDISAIGGSVGGEVSGITGVVSTRGEDEERQVGYPYDGGVLSRSGGWFEYSTVSQLASLSDAPFFISRHYGDWVVPETAVELLPISMVDYNDENHYIVVHDPNYADYGNSSIVTLIYTGQTSGATYTRVLLPVNSMTTASGARTTTANNESYVDNGFETDQFCHSFQNGSERVYYVLIDSMTTGATGNQDGHFADRFPGFIAGEDITVQASVTVRTPAGQYGTRGYDDNLTVRTNSLFASIDESKYDEKSSYVAHITNGRHLQNLEYSISHLGQKSWQTGSTLVDNGFAMSQASIDADILWEDGSDFASGSGLTAFWTGLASCPTAPEDYEAINDPGDTSFSSADFSSWQSGNASGRAQQLIVLGTNDGTGATTTNWRPINTLTTDPQGVVMADQYQVEDSGVMVTRLGFVVEGNNHRIINLRTNTTDTGINRALFDSVTRDRTSLAIQHLFMVNPSMQSAANSTDSAAALIAEAGTTGSGALAVAIDGCGVYASSATEYFKGSYNLASDSRGVNAADGRRIFSGLGNAGGLIARSNCDLRITDSFVTMPVAAGNTGSEYSAAAGGLVGWVQSGANSTVALGRSYVGGFLHGVDVSTATSYAYDQHSVGIVQFSANPVSAAGGLIGWFSPSSAQISNCYSTASVASNHLAGGILGGASLNANQRINNVYATGAVYYPANNAQTFGGRFMAAGSVIDASLLSRVFTNCQVLSAVNTDFCATPDDYTHPVNTLGLEANEGPVANVTTSQLRAQGIADVQSKGPVATRAFNIVGQDYPYPAVTATGKGREAVTGTTSAATSRARAYYGDWPVFTPNVTLEDHNDENHYIVVTDNDFKAGANTSFGANGLVTLKYETIDTNGNPLVYIRELHPEYAVTVDSNGSGNTTVFADRGSESSQFCKYYDEVYYDIDDTWKVRRRYYVLIDSITTLIEQNQEGHANDRLRGIAPGANITVTAYVMVNGSPVEQESVETNSLFASIDPVEEGSNQYTAHITNARHLQNLTPLISGLDNYNNAVKIAGLSLDKDIMWEDVYDRNDVVEEFYDASGSRINPFWSMITGCISQEARDSVQPDSGNVKYSFNNWTQPRVYRGYPGVDRSRTQTAFSPIQLLDSFVGDTGVTNFEANGNNHRIINLTMGDRNASNDIWGNRYGAIGLFEMPGAYNKTSKVQDNLKLDIHDLYLVNPNSEFNNKNDTGAASFVGEAWCYVNMRYCGAYMSSVDQYWMGSANLEDPHNYEPQSVSSFDPTWGMHSDRGRRMFSKQGSAGGLIGRAVGSLAMSDCFAAVPMCGGVNGSSNGSAAGGLVGYVRGRNNGYTVNPELGTRIVTIENSYSGGFLSGSETKLDADSEIYTYSAESVGITTFSNVGSSGSGGFIGYIEWGNNLTIQNCYSTVAVGGSMKAAGAIGNMSNNSGTHIIDCYSLGAVFSLKSAGRSSGLFCNCTGNITQLKSMFTDCYTFGLVNTEFTEETEHYGHPVASAGGNRGQGGDDSEIIPFHFESAYEGDKVIDLDFLEKDRKDHNGVVNRTATSSYNIWREDYPYRAVTKAGQNVVPVTGITTAQRAKYVHVGDWPAIVYGVDVENVNAENNYLAITNNNYKAGEAPAFGADGTIVVEYKTIDTSGNQLVYQRELHPEYAATVKKPNSQGTQVLANASGKMDGTNTQIGFETGQFCKYYDEEYVDSKGNEKICRRYYVLIDSITTAFAANQSGHATAGAYGRFPDMAPGAPIDITVYLRSGGSMVKIDTVSTNSLFASAEPVEEGSNQYVAHITNARHLQNLSPRFALLDNTNSALKVAQVSIDADIMWEDVYDRDGELEEFYDDGVRVNPFWTQVSACLPEAIRDACADWTQATLSVSDSTGKAATNIAQTAFAPIQLLDRSVADTGVTTFDVQGNNHRLLNFTLGGKTSDTNQVKIPGASKGNYGAIGLFETPGTYGQNTTFIQNSLILSINDLFIVNPNISLAGITVKPDVSAGAFVGECSCRLVMNNCGAYMSSLDQYWMGSADMEDRYNVEQQPFDPAKGKHSEAGRRILSNAGGAGGIVGVLHGSCDITNCFGAVPVYGGSRGSFTNASAGGLVGTVRDKTQSDRAVNISNCYAGGFLSSGTTDVGEGQSAYTYSSESVGIAQFSDDSKAGAGGLIGKLDWGKNVNVENCYSTASIAAVKNAGGFLGECAGLTGGGVHFVDCYALGSVYVSNSIDGGMFCATQNTPYATLQRVFTDCYAFGAANSAFTEETPNYVHPTTSTGSKPENGGPHRDGSDVIPFHYESAYEGDIVIDTDYLIADRENHLETDTNVATKGYSIKRADYPYRAVTGAGAGVVDNTGPTPSVDGYAAVHVGDWPYIRSASTVTVAVDNAEKLTAKVQLPKSQLALATTTTVLVKGDKSGKGALLRFTVTPDENAESGYSFTMDDPGDSNDANVTSIGRTEADRTAWTATAQVTCTVEGDNVVLSFVLDDPLNADVANTFANLLGTTCGLLPGEDVAIAVDLGGQTASYMVGIAGNPSYMEGHMVVKTNSLYGEGTTLSDKPVPDFEPEEPAYVDGEFVAVAKVSSVRHLHNIGVASADAKITATSAIQTADIAIDEELAGFTGIDAANLAQYDGGGFSISGINISNDTGNAGLFGNACKNGDMEVKNLTLAGTVTTDAEGAFAGSLVNAVGVSSDATAQHTLTITNVTDEDVTVTPEGCSIAWPEEMSDSYRAVADRCTKLVGAVYGKNNVVIDGVVIVSQGQAAPDRQVLVDAIAAAQAALERGDNADEGYHAAYADLQEALEAAQVVFNNASATLSDVVGALAGLESAQTAFGKAAAKYDLGTAIASAEAVYAEAMAAAPEPSEQQAQLLANLRTVIGSAQAIFEQDATQEQYEEATSLLNQSVEGFNLEFSGLGTESVENPADAEANQPDEAQPSGGDEPSGEGGDTPLEPESIDDASDGAENTQNGGDNLEGASAAPTESKGSQPADNEEPEE